MTTRILGALVALTIAAPAWAAVPAEDEEAAYPLRFVERPLTLPRHGLLLGATVPVIRGPRPDGSVQRVVGLAVNGAFGVTDDFAVSVSPVVLQLAPEPLVGDASLAARYRLRGRGSVEVALTLSLQLPFQDDFLATPQVNVRIHGGDVFALDTGALLEFRFSDPSVIAFAIPIRPTVQLSDHLFAGINTGLVVATLDRPGDSLYFPLAFDAGVTLGDERPLCDLTAAVEFPLFWIPAADDSLVTELYILRVSASFYFFL